MRLGRGNGARTPYEAEMLPEGVDGFIGRSPDCLCVSPSASSVYLSMYLVAKIYPLVVNLYPLVVSIYPLRWSIFIR